MASPEFGEFTDEQCVAFFTRKLDQLAESHPHLQRDELLAAHPLVRCMLQGTKPSLALGSLAPDGPVCTLDGVETTLHGAVRAGSGPRKLTVLNFGSYT
mmetsp:Transcript_14973/g.46876  ORF Transcript_14973/g.46876 Transcript_14973/m.46876 type:complete len:99 (-) Transcript_14973:656-952(-)